MGSIFSSPTPLTPEMAAAIKTKVDAIIAENAIVVFSKSYCPYCTKAKKLLEKLGAKAFILELDNIEDGADIQAYLQTLTGQRTVPNIFISQKHIGGCDSLLALDNSGELKTLLAKI
ncbi:putative GRX1-glutaredoxin [Linnemannia elongata]|nr:putative GRX1-glutaredoxin [Linnemannia elongata]KAK5808831.1 putative GRX1-glutaredoxin [Linnemannia elongata]